MIAPNTITRCAAQALTVLAVEQPALVVEGRPKLLPPGPGAANLLVRVSTASGPVIVKIRLDPDDDASREAWALRRLDVAWAPRLLADTTADELRARSGRAGLARNQRMALEPRWGGVLVLQALPHAPLPPKPEASALRAVGAAVAALHQQPERKGRGRAPVIASAPQALGNNVAVLLDTLATAPGVNAALVDALTSRWRAVRRSLPRGAGARVLCHGDLRLHNLGWHDDAPVMFDFEHAGWGDAAFDLALFSARTPLQAHQELCVLDGYLAGIDRREHAQLLERFFAFKPAAEVLGAVAGLVDVVDVYLGARPVWPDRGAYLAKRRPEAEAAAARVLGERQALFVERRTRRGVRSSVAVDGPACSGKSVVASAAAHVLGLPHLNTGAAYRWAAALAHERGWRADRDDDVERLLKALKQSRWSLSDDGALTVGPHRVEGSLLSLPVESTVAAWAALAGVRALLTEGFRASMRGRSVVVEGRDACAVLAPRARHRWYVDASVAVRAQRLRTRLPVDLGLPEVRALLTARDRQDQQRAHAPLVCPPGASVLDTTRSSRGQTVGAALALLEEGR